VAGDAAVGKEIGRVGEDEVDGIFGDFFEDFAAVALIDAEVVFGVVEGGSGERIGDGFGHRTVEIVDQVGIVNQPVKQVKAGKGRKGLNTENAENTENTENTPTGSGQAPALRGGLAIAGGYRRSFGVWRKAKRRQAAALHRMDFALAY
jgi:hypothetical protein